MPKQHNLYRREGFDDASAEFPFRPYLLDAINATLDGRTGIKISDMKVARDMDGGPVYPLD